MKASLSKRGRNSVPGIVKRAGNVDIVIGDELFHGRYPSCGGGEVRSRRR